jgi:ribosomal protein L32
MQLPKYDSSMHKVKKSKICQEPGCGKEFIGHRIAKYCDFHRETKNRVRKRKLATDPGLDNMIFNHNFHEVTSIEFTCQFPRCNTKFVNRVFPKQEIYPKYCERHRSAYKRGMDERIYRNGQKLAA